MVSGQPSAASRLLGPADVRRLAAAVGLRPSKSLGQNFVVDANTVRRIVRLAGVGPDDVVLEVGPGLGSLTLALLPEVARVVAVEVDHELADALPATVREFAPAVADRLDVVEADAARIRVLPDGIPTVMVANLPYKVAVPVLLHLLDTFPALERGLVMVQKEVADRLAAAPGSRTYGVPSVKTAWYARVRQVGTVTRTVFWPMPNVDSGLVALERRDPPVGADRRAVFAVVDAAFAQRRKTLRAALAGWAGSPTRAEQIVHRAGVDPGVRGERLGVEDFVRIAGAASGGPAASGGVDR